jgi:hypothetical protein
LILGILVVGILVGGGRLSGYRGRAAAAEPAGWGQGKLKVSERAYFMKRVDRIIREWPQTRREAEHDRNGRLKEPYGVYLVVDTDKPAMWIERDGRVQEEDYCQFPAGMTWTIYRSVAEGDTEMGRKMRLKIRGHYTKQVFPEMIYLAGQGRGVGHLSFNFNSNSHGSGSGSGGFVLPPYTDQHTGKEDDEDYYASIVVTDAEYERYVESLVDAASESKSVEERKGDEESPVAQNKKKWNRVETQLYQGIEREVIREGLDLEGLKLEIGPDYSAGHAEIRVDRDSFFKRFFRRGSAGEGYLKFDHLGQDVWYVRSGPRPDRPMPMMGRRRVDLEFLVCAAGEIGRSERKVWLEKGRARQQPVTRPESKWQVTLANGVRVEFIGICENPSGGKPWWGPDGSVLGYVPYVNWETYGPGRDEDKIYEMAWRVESPDVYNPPTAGKTGRPSSGAPGIVRRTVRGVGSTGSLEGCRGSSYHSIFDRYAHDVRDIHAEGYTFEKSREKTTWKAGFKLGDQDYEWVKFKNISLVRGRDFGFEIELGE